MIKLNLFTNSIFIAFERAKMERNKTNKEKEKTFKESTNNKYSYVWKFFFSNLLLISYSVCYLLPLKVKLSKGVYQMTFGKMDALLKI